jgi:hypothetical protein
MHSDVLEQRALSLATVLFTRHPDVQVVRTPLNAGYDLDVRIARKGVISGRLFAVELKARPSLQRLGRMMDSRTVRLSKDLKRSLTKLQNVMRDLPYPLLLLAFAMDSDRAFYCWLRKPALPHGASRRLHSPSIETAQEWSRMTHTEIVGVVNDWYDTVDIKNPT